MQVTATELGAVPVVLLLTPRVSFLQRQQTYNSFTADILQIHCCVRMLACVKLLAMLTLDEDMLQSTMPQSNRLQSNKLQSNRLQSNMLQSNRVQSNMLQPSMLQSNRLQSSLLQSNLLQLVYTASHAHKEP